MSALIKKIALIGLISIYCIQYTFAQSPPKREFRAAWVATVVNIDYPSTSKLGSDAQKQEWIALLDNYQKMGLNAVIAQIRPAGDAFYPSKLVPWSKYLTGKQGAQPVPYYDPLAFMIAETHKRGMEFHAWLNPYRATMNLDKSILAPTHELNQHPEWFVQYGKKYYFNPGLEPVRNHLNEVVKEIITNYEVDAIHFDDYFYPYKVKGKEFPDSTAFATYGQEFANIGDWRRDNVDRLIKQLSETIKVIKPHIKFGISPFGVWRNKSTDPINGSAGRASIQSYDDLNADILKWLEKDWIDYVAPQLYWYIGFAVADYEVLLKWWSEHTYGKDLYIGHAAYKVGNGGRYAEWENPNEIPKQIEMNRANSAVLGSIYFSTRSLKANKLGVADSLSSYYQYPALLPENKKTFVYKQRKPRLYRAKKRDGGIRLRWKHHRRDAKNMPLYYVVYRFEGKKVGNFDDPRNILTLTGHHSTKREIIYIDKTAKKGQYYTYVIKPVNKLHQEGKSSRTRKKRIR